MDNKNIPTSYGTIIILIIAVTVGAFVWKYEERQGWGTVENSNSAIQKKTITGDVQGQKKSSQQGNKQSYDEIQKELQTLDTEGGTITYASISKDDYLLMTKNDKYSTGLYAEQYFKYENKRLGISFVYTGHLKSYIKEISQGKLQFIRYDSTNNGSYFPNSQDYIEIYNKRSSDTLEDAIKSILVQKGANIKNCKLNILSNYVNGQALDVTYKDSFVYDKNNCLASDQGSTCQLRQMGKYNKIASNSCSTFERGSFYNYFIYQPESTTNKIVFVRHVSGLDASPWDPSTIRLFN